jgi:hypothetical protein
MLWLIVGSLFDPGSGLVLFVSDLLHPVDRLVELFLDGDVRHRRRGRCPMPMLLSGRTRDYVTRPDFLDGPAPALYPAAVGRHDQRLAERMRVPRGTRTRLERDAGNKNTLWIACIKQRIDPNRAAEIVR